MVYIDGLMSMKLILSALIYFVGLWVLFTFVGAEIKKIVDKRKKK